MCERPEEMGHYLTKPTEAKSDLASEAVAKNNSTIKMTTIYNMFLALADKQDAHHSDTVSLFVIVVCVIAIVVGIILLKIANKHYKKKVDQRARQLQLSA